MEITNKKAKQVYELLLNMDPHPIAYMYACWCDNENNSELKMKNLLGLAVKALEKQIDFNVFDIGNDKGMYKDGYCKCGQYVTDEVNYCHNCGQKLNWTHED